MKKVLTLFLAVSLVFGAFAGMAGAAELTTTQKYDQMAEAGIFNGNTPAGDRDLDQPMTRAQLAKVIALTLGLDNAPASANAYKDIVSYHWGKPYIGAVVKAGIMNGVSATAFKPNANMKIEELAKVLVVASGLEPKEGATVEGKVEKWAVGYVAAALEAGLIEKAADYTKDALRAALVEGAYTLYAPTPATAAIESAKVVGAKKIEVKFNKAVDTAAAKFAVSNGTAAVNYKTVTFSEDKKTATIEFNNSLVEATYTVKVTGLTTDALSASVAAVAEKVDKITLTSDKAPLVRNSNNQVNIFFKIFNQYGEDVTATYYSSIVPSVSKGQTSPTIGNGVITYTAPSGSTYALDEKLAVSLSFVNTNSSAFVNGTLTVSAQSGAANISISKVYNVDGKTLNKGNIATNSFYLILDVKDQFGNAITNPTDLASDLFVTVSNPSVASVVGYGANNTATFTNVTIDGVTYAALQLAPVASSGTQLAGTSQISVISKSNGNRASYDVVSADTAKVDTLTLSAPANAIAGKEITVPYTAVDQFGNAVTDASSLNAITALNVAGVTANSADPTQYTIKFFQNYVTGKAELKIDARRLSDATVLNVVAVTNTGKTAYLVINVVKPSVPTSISAVDAGVSKAYAVQGTDTLNLSDITVLDQYGLETSLGSYKIAISTSDSSKVAVSGTDSAVDGSTTYTTIDSDGVTLTGAAKGSSTITLTLLNGSNKAISNSNLSFTARVVEKADIANYSVADLPKLYNGGGSYQRDVNVTGALSDGTSVAVPNTYYDVTSTVYNGTSKKLDGSLASGLTTSTTEKTYPVYVTINAASGAVNIVKQVTVSNVAPVATTLSLVAGSYTKESDKVISAPKANADTFAKIQTLAYNVIKSVDQYGEELTGANEQDDLTIKVSDFSNGHSFSAGNIAAGDAVDVTVIADGNSTPFVFHLILK